MRGGRRTARAYGLGWWSVADARHTARMPPAATPTDDLAERLARLMGSRIEGLQRLSGGASRETWAFDAIAADGGRQALILRRDPPGAVRVGGMPLEARMFRAAAAVGVPVPTLHHSGGADESLLGTGFLVMDRLAGETIARKILRDPEFAHARTVTVGQMGAALARLHAVPVDSIEGLEPSDAMTKYRTTLDESGFQSPTFELAFRWLVANRPTSRPTTVVHGDFRLGNVIIGPDGLVAVLDWELAHLGDPMADFGWLCARVWSFGGPGPVAGMGTYQQLFDAYEAAGGAKVDPEVVRWWVTLSTLMWGVMCVMQATAHTSGAIRSVELAAIGRRVAEQEHDLLDLLGVASVVPPAVPPAPTAYDLRGFPSSRLLLEALREYLERDVMAATGGRVQFHGRVAANVVSIIDRELALGPELVRAHTEGIAAFGVSDEAGLAAAIRSGALDDRLGEVGTFARRIVSTRLAIANPKYAR